MWNIILSTLNGNKIIVESKNNPSKSGRYVCTCIYKEPFSDVKTLHKYPKIMEYDLKTNSWHDVGHSSSLSHNILAWTNIELCKFEDFDYEAGYLFEKGQI